MLQRLSTTFGLCLVLLCPLAAQAATGDAAPFAWDVRPGDYVVVNVETNLGTLYHRNGESITFPVATGQRRTVNYIGRTYYAGTPVRQWTVLAEDIKDASFTFGKTGRFLRLFTSDGKSSPYGIHSIANVDQIMSDEKRYRSMGCILVSEEVLNVLERLFLQNGEISVLTTTQDL